MKSVHKYYVIVSLIAFNILFQVFYWLYFREKISTMYYAENVEGFWAAVVETFYPRFFVEKHRFDLSFFLAKTEQIVWRFALLSSVLAGLFVFLKRNFWENSFWNVVISRKKVLFLQILLALGWLYESFTWYNSLLRLSHLKELYEPCWLVRFIPFPDEEAVFYWFAVFYLFLLLSFVPRVASVFWSLSVILAIILLGFLYGFSKIDHTYATWLYVSMLLPFLLKNKNEVEAWALRLMQCVVAMVYLQAGLEKLLISGWEWFLPQTLQSHLEAHPTTWGLAI
ncbi:MAG: hypothetical protein ACK40K_07740, partial [Raineya sp.]